MRSDQQKVIVTITGQDGAELRRVEVLETSAHVAQGARRPEHLAQAALDGLYAAWTRTQ